MKKKFARASHMVGLSLVIAGLLNWAALFAPAGGAAWRAHHSMANTPTFAARLARPPAGPTTTERLCEQYNNLPLRFEAAAPQTNAPAQFITRSGAHTVLLTASEAIVALRSRDASDEGSDRAGKVRLQKPVSSPDERQPQTTLVRWKLVGANVRARVAGLTELPGRNNHFIGNDPKRWRADVPAFARVQFACVYPGVDLIYYGSAGQLEYDFNVAPGASYESIRWRFSGVERLSLDESGGLVIDTPAGQIRQHKPLVYQLINGTRKEIAARYRISRQHEVGFVIGDYDRRQALVIDPMLSISTYLGGVRGDSIAAVAVDATGNAYVTGRTNADDFPTTANALKPTHPTEPCFLGDVDPLIFPCTDAFVTKLNANGTALVYSTYLGGSSVESGAAIAV